VTVSGVAQWSRRRSLSRGLSLTCSQSTVDRWPLCGYNVHYGSVN